jgi:hypothetical protein
VLHFRLVSSFIFRVFHLHFFLPQQGRKVSLRCCHDSLCPMVSSLFLCVLLF